MKFRSRRFLSTSHEENFWPSFVDVMTTVAIVFFFMMLIFTYFVYGKYRNVQVTYDKLDDIAKQRAELYERLENDLKPKLGDDIIFDKENGRLEIKTEVLFQVDKYELTGEGVKIAKEVSEAFYTLFSNPVYRDKIKYVEVKGHTDNTFLADYNRFLSTNRAASFVNAMVPNGSKYEEYAAYFKSSGMSKFEPKVGSVDGQSMVEQDQNRRIEINIELNDKDIEEAIKTLLGEG